MKKIIAVKEEISNKCDGCVFDKQFIGSMCVHYKQTIDGEEFCCSPDHVIYKEIDTITESKEYKEITEIVVKVLKENKDDTPRGSYVALYIGASGSVYILASNSVYKLKGSNWVSNGGDDLFKSVEELANYVDFIKDNIEYMIWQVN